MGPIRSELRAKGRPARCAVCVCAMASSSSEDESGPAAKRVCVRNVGTKLEHKSCESVMATLNQEVDLIVADPPYESVVSASWDQYKYDEYKNFTKRWLALAVQALRQGGVLLIYGSPERTWISRIAVMLEDELNMEVKQQLAWVYNQGGGSRVSSMKKLAVQHELLLWAQKPGGAQTFNAADCVEHYREDERAVALAKGKGRVSESSLDRGRPPRTFLDFPRENARSKERSYGQHPSMKPLALCEHLIKLFSNESELVLVPFAGSGSEMLSAAKLGRRCVGCEISSEYCDLIRRRFAGHELELG